MSIQEVLEMRRIIITSNLPDEKIGRLNELINKALEDAKNEAINEVYAYAMNNSHDSLIEWLQDKITD